MNYIIFDTKKFRILRCKIFQTIIYNFFKYINIKIAIIVVLLINFYVIIENILQNIDQIKKINQKKNNAITNCNFDINNNYINYANHNQNNKKFQKNKKIYVNINRIQLQSQNQQQKNQFKFKKKKNKNKKKIDVAITIC